VKRPLRRIPIVRGAVLAALLVGGPILAHSGPPFPIVSSRAAGPYEVSVWTDPDSTDDGSAGGQFWITVRPSGAAALPSGTRVTVALEPLGRQGPSRTASAEPVAADPSQRFAALVMDHEGRFRVRVTVDGPLGAAQVDHDGTVMALRHRTLPIHGVQFHPESIMTREGQHLLRNFLNL
jgi:hypothetical protein